MYPLTANWTIRSVRLLASAAIAIFFSAAVFSESACGQEAGRREYGFPWGCSSVQVHPSLPTQVIPPYRKVAPATAPAVPVLPAAQKPTYSYGWFGVQPSYAWSRHFGVSKNFTQWSQK